MPARVGNRRCSGGQRAVPFGNPPGKRDVAGILCLGCGVLAGNRGDGPG
ncbi:hypothetical protein NY78_3749 [Desulfovibrio sp. TomC]|nr:hypothetical protein NY78_3749 [Desulfovibrio sp. TomC]